MTQLNDIVLIIDDEPSIRETAAFILKMEGFQVEKACNGVEGLQQIKQKKPKVILLDVMMPKMDGYELCEIIKNDNELKDIFVVMLTAKGQEIDEQKAMKAGADTYLTKPFDTDEILRHIKKIFP